MHISMRIRFIDYNDNYHYDIVKSYAVASTCWLSAITLPSKY